MRFRKGQALYDSILVELRVVRSPWGVIMKKGIDTYYKIIAESDGYLCISYPNLTMKKTLCNSSSM
jgi:hypothetical protein